MTVMTLWFSILYMLFAAAHGHFRAETIHMDTNEPLESFTPPMFDDPPPEGEKRTSDQEAKGGRRTSPKVGEPPPGKVFVASVAHGGQVVIENVTKHKKTAALAVSTTSAPPADDALQNLKKRRQNAIAQKAEQELEAAREKARRDLEAAREKAKGEQAQQEAEARDKEMKAAGVGWPEAKEGGNASPTSSNPSAVGGDAIGMRQDSRSDDAHPCFDLSAWKKKFAKSKRWRVFSHGDQDSVLDSIFSERWMGTSSKFFVQLGFSAPTSSWSNTTKSNTTEQKAEAIATDEQYYEQKAGTSPNTQYLKFRRGWSGVLLDGENEDLKINLHRASIREDNIDEVFHKHGVPVDVDYISIDTGYCDLYMFRDLIASTKFKPNVITVKYNMNYHCVESKTNVCRSGEEYYQWHNDNLYGASLLALARVADENGYTLAWVETGLDAVFIRKDRLCPKSSVPFNEFCYATGHPMHQGASTVDQEKWIAEYPGSLVP